MSLQTKLKVEKAVVAVDQRSKSRVLSLPFVLPDGSDAVAIICRIKNENWIPNIESITIDFK